MAYSGDITSPHIVHDFKQRTMCHWLIGAMSAEALQEAIEKLLEIYEFYKPPVETKQIEPSVTTFSAIYTGEAKRPELYLSEE